MIIESYYQCLLLILTIGVSLLETSSIHRQKRYTKDDICHQTNSTLTVVDSCQCSEEERRKRRQDKKCHEYPPCQGEQLEYHCVMHIGRFVEVCAPKVQITGHCCAEFNEGVGRITEDQFRSCSTCPFDYFSTEFAKQLECVQSALNTKRYMAQTTIESKSSVAASTTHQPNHDKPSGKSSSSFKSKLYDESSETESINYVDSPVTEKQRTRSLEETNPKLHLLFLVLVPIIGGLYFGHKYNLSERLKNIVVSRTHYDNEVGRETTDMEESKTPLAAETIIKTETITEIYPDKL